MRIATSLRHHLGATYETILEATSEAERLGYDCIFFPDHYLPTDSMRENPQGRFGPIDDDPAAAGPTDAWALLAGLARETSSIRLGTLMTSSTFRLPGPLAIMVAQVNQMSGGRLDFGIGTNWYEPEHRAYGIPYPSLGERFDRLEEQLAVVHGLWSTPRDQRFDFAGAHYSLEHAVPISPPASGAHAPIIIGGRGLVRTPRLAARYAAEANGQVIDGIDDVWPFFAACERACEEMGRDPATLSRSVIMRVCCGEDEADLERQARLTGYELGQLRASMFVGTPEALTEHLRGLEDLGITRVMLTRRLPIDLAGLRLIGAEVVSRLRDDAGVGTPRR